MKLDLGVASSSPGALARELRWGADLRRLAPAPPVPVTPTPPPASQRGGRRPWAARPDAAARLPPFVPPEPQVLEGQVGSKVWLLERHALPLVTVAVVVPYGSAREPTDKAGLAFVTADMLDEGAGDRDALAFSQAVNDLGARLASSADRDASSCRSSVLAEQLRAGVRHSSADAVARPRTTRRIGSAFRPSGTTR